jgi:type II secretory pathway component PulM
MSTRERQLTLIDDLLATLQALAKEVEKLEARMAQAGLHMSADSQIRVVVSSLSELKHRASKLLDHPED